MIESNLPEEFKATKGAQGMGVEKQLNTTNSFNITQTSLASVSMRELFLNWLVDGNVREYSIEMILSCLDRISDYSVKRKISDIGIWKYVRFNDFEPTYNKLLRAKLLKIINRGTYKVFIVAGELYLKFLKEEPWIQKVPPADEVIKSAMTKKQIDLKEQSEKVINPEDVIAWSVTQLNARGTLYLEHVVRQYMKSLRSSPMKLLLNSLESRDVFACSTVAELDKLWNFFKTAPNYKKVNSTISNMFSAGLGLYRRYLEGIDDNNGQNINVQPVRAPKQGIVPSCSEILLKILEEHFPNGFRSNSSIETRRLRGFIMEDYGEKVLLSDEELNKLILSLGTLFEGKVYIVRAEIKEKIKKIIDLAIEGGTKIIFYGAFYMRNESWLFSASIISERMLKNLLMSIYPRFVHKKNYFAFGVKDGNESTKVRYEIFRVWGNDISLSYEQLSKRLPYIPVDKIKRVLAQGEEFIWNVEGVYTHISNVDITDEEYTSIVNFVAATYIRDGYASLKDVPLGEIAERNYELSHTAIHNAVYAIVLADKYDKRGQIIIRKGDTLDALSVMKEHCRSLEKCSLCDLLDFERELTGKTHRWVPMEAAYSVMVRTSKDSYVAERYVSFDSIEIDGILDHFVTGDYLPLKSVTTFAAFPHCGQPWNLFLLESYCRRFSDKFCFEASAVNSSNVGVIARKSCCLSYHQIMEDAVAKSDISLKKAVILDFLYNNGYIGRRSYAKVNELIKQIKVTRGGRK